MMALLNEQNNDSAGLWCYDELSKAEPQNISLYEITNTNSQQTVCLSLAGHSTFAVKGSTPLAVDTLQAHLISSRGHVWLCNEKPLHIKCIQYIVHR